MAMPTDMREPTAQEIEDLERAIRFKRACERLCVAGIVAIRARSQENERRAREHMGNTISELFTSDFAKAFAEALTLELAEAEAE